MQGHCGAKAGNGSVLVSLHWVDFDSHATSTQQDWVHLGFRAESDLGLISRRS